MMKGVMMTAMLAVTDIPATGESEPAPAKSEPPTGQSEGAQGKTEAGVQVVKSLVSAGKQAYTSPYTVTVKKIESIQGSNQVRVTFFVTGEDEPAHDFTETDLAGFAIQRQASGTAGVNLDVIVPSEVLHDSHEMVLGNAIGVADLFRGHDALRMRRQVYQGAKRIVGA